MILEGIRILDLSRMLPGPYGSMLLGDLGAEVIRVENPREIDMARAAPPLIGGVGSMYLMINRNKKSITLDLKKERGRDVFMDLAKTADVIFEQFRPGVVQRLGLGYEDVKAVKPDIIYCSLSGFGQDGPYRDRVGHDLNYLSVAGFVGMNRRKNEAPVLPGFAVADLTGGIFAAFSIIAALYDRERTGQGRYIDVSICDVVVSLASNLFGEVMEETEDVDGSRGGKPWSALAREGPFYGVYETKDGGYISLGAIEHKFWINICMALGHPELVDKQFVLGEEAKEVSSLLGEIFKTKTREEWEEELDGQYVPFAAVNSIREMAEDPQVKAREMIGTLHHPEAGEIKQIKSPVKFGEDAEVLRTPPPRTGEHTEAILKELGYGDNLILGLRDNGVI